MNTDYLNNYSEADLTAYINSLNELRANTSYSYEPYYVAIKGTSALETLDARARLGTIETKEDLDNLEARVSSIEEAISNSTIGSGDSMTIKPTTKLVERGTQIVKSTDWGHVMWTREPVYGNNIYAVITGTGLGLSISYDNGKTFKSIGIGDINFVGIDTTDGEWAFRMFRYGEIVFYNDKFFIYSPLGLDYDHPKVFSTEDFKTFTLVDTNNEYSKQSAFLVVNNDLLLFSGGKVFKYSNNTNKFEYIGQTTYNIDYFSKVDMSNRFVLFNNAVYFINDDELFKMSDNYLDADNITPETELNSIDKMYTINNYLFISDQTYAYYSADGEAWESVNIPHSENNQIEDVLTDGGIDIMYNESDGLYYGLICSSNIDDYNGIYCWENLSETPVAVTPDEEEFKEDVHYSDEQGMKKCMGKIFFHARGTLYTVANKSYEKVADIDDGSFEFTYTGYFSNPLNGWFLASADNRLLIVNNNSSEAYIEMPIYTLESYNGTGDESNIIITTL